jgi:hypothetical protein
MNKSYNKRFSLNQRLSTIIGLSKSYYTMESQSFITFLFQDDSTSHKALYINIQYTQHDNQQATTNKNIS